MLRQPLLVCHPIRRNIMYESSQSSDFDSDNVLITQKRVKKRPLSPPLSIPPPTSKTETTSTTIIPHPHHTKTTTTTTTTQTTTNIARQYDVVEGHERRKTTTTTTITTTQVIVVDDIEILEDDISISRPDPPSIHDVDTSRLDPESVSRIDPPSLHVEEEEDVDVSQIGSVHISHGDDEDDDILPTHTTPLRHTTSPPPKQPYSPHNGENKPNSKPSSPKNLTAIPPSVTSPSPSKSPLPKRNSLTKQHKQTKNKKSFVDKLRGRLRSSYQSMPGQNTKPSPTLRELDPIKSEPVSLPSIDDAVRILQRGMIMTIYLKHRVNLPPRSGTPSKQPISPKVGSGKQTTPWSDGGMTVIHSRRIFLWGQVFLDESTTTANHNDNHNKSPTHDLTIVDGSGAIIGDSNTRWNRELKTHLHRHALYWTELEEPKPTHKKKASATTTQSSQQSSSQQSSKKPHPTPSHSKHPSQSTIPSLSRSVSMPMPIHQPSKQMERNMSPIPTSSHLPLSSSPPGGLDMDVLSTSPQRDPFDMTSLSRTSPAPGIASNQSMTPITSNPSSHPSSGAISPELKGASIPMGMALDSFALDDADDWVSPPVSPSNMPQPAPTIPPSTPPLTGSTPPHSSSPPRVDRTPSITHGNTIRRVLDPGHCLPFTQISDLYLGQKTQTFQIFQQLASLPPSQRPTGLPSLPAVDLSFSVESVSPENNLHVSTANKDTRNSFFFAIYRFLMEIQQGIMTLEEDSFKKQQLAEMNAMGMDM